MLRRKRSILPDLVSQVSQSWPWILSWVDVDRDVVEGELLAAGVHADGHGGAGAEAGGDELVGGGALVGAAVARGLVGLEQVLGAGGDVLEEALRARLR